MIIKSSSNVDKSTLLPLVLAAITTLQHRPQYLNKWSKVVLYTAVIVPLTRLSARFFSLRLEKSIYTALSISHWFYQRYHCDLVMKTCLPSVCPHVCSSAHGLPRLLQHTLSAPQSSDPSLAPGLFTMVFFAPAHDCEARWQSITNVVVISRAS